jgi:hypothetical protein
MHARVIAYNYLANKLGWPTKQTLEEVGIDADKNRVPLVKHQTYLVDSLKLVSTIYGFENQQYGVKVVGSEVTEFYVRKPEGIVKPNLTYVTYDVKTGEPLEYYCKDSDGDSGAKIETKYNFKTDEVMQVNHFAKTAELPEDVKKRVATFKYKNNIFIYAEKPYGRIVECVFN